MHSEMIEALAIECVQECRAACGACLADPMPGDWAALHTMMQERNGRAPTEIEKTDFARAFAAAAGEEE